MAQIKTIGSNGQISLGKEFAGKNVLIENPEPGVWIIKVGEFIPLNETWIHESANSAKLDKALNWAAANKPKKNDLTNLENKLK